MFRPAIQKLSSLILMAVFCVVMTIISYKSQLDYKKPHYDKKVQAANYMFESLKVLRQEYKDIPTPIKSQADQSNNGNVTDLNDIESKRSFSSLDPLETGLVFYQDGLPGNPSSKLTTLNPNFAALVVDLMIEAGVKVPEERKRKPKVAVAFSSSFPGANLAVLSACKTLDVEPVVITSLSGSNYGAIDYNQFSWLDMEKKLIDSKIFPSTYKSKAVSIGRGNDSGIGLDSLTIKAIKGAINKHDIDFIYNEKEIEMEYYIDKRMETYFNRNDNAPYDLFINVGGGHASIGASNEIRNSPGFLSLEYLDEIYKDNTDDCAMFRFSQKESTPAINIIDIEKLVEDSVPIINLSDKKFKIDWSSNKWINLDEGSQLWRSEYNKSGILFLERKYNFWVVIPCLLASLLVVLSIGIYSHFQIKRRMTSYEPDSI